MRDGTGTAPWAASGEVDIELWRAVARTLLRRAQTPSFDDLLAEIADFEDQLLRLVGAVKHRLQEPVSIVQEVAAREALEGLAAFLEGMPADVRSASDLARLMARRVLRLCVVVEFLDGCL
jgi:hypothetical protein